MAILILLLLPVLFLLLLLLLAVLLLLLLMPHPMCSHCGLFSLSQMGTSCCSPLCSHPRLSVDLMQNLHTLSVLSRSLLVFFKAEHELLM